MCINNHHFLCENKIFFVPLQPKMLEKWRSDPQNVLEKWRYEHENTLEKWRCVL